MGLSWSDMAKIGHRITVNEGQAAAVRLGSIFTGNPLWGGADFKRELSLCGTSLLIGERIHDDPEPGCLFWFLLAPRLGFEFCQEQHFAKGLNFF